jgi:urea transporter
MRASWVHQVPAVFGGSAVSSGEEIPVLQALREGVSRVFVCTVYMLHCSKFEAMVHPQSY